MSPKYPKLQGIVFFISFFLTAIVLEAGLLGAMGVLFNTRLAPRGLGWIAFPIAAGATGWAFGREIGLERVLAKVQAKLFSIANKRIRGLIAGSLLWFVFVIAVFLVFDPFQRYRWQGEEWTKFIFVLFGLPSTAIVGVYLFDWVMKDRSNETTSNGGSGSARYKPTDAVFEVLLWSLTALIATRDSVETKIRWIEEFHRQVRGVPVGKHVILDLAERFRESGPYRILDILQNKRDLMEMKDREFLVKAACLLSSVEGPMSKVEKDLIMQFADVLDIGPDRLREL
jgi:hypothetical protein